MEAKNTKVCICVAICIMNFMTFDLMADWKFDFEPTDGTTETGYTHIDDSNSYSYSVEQGYGFTVLPTGNARSRTVGDQTALLKDFISLTSGTPFRVDLMNGTYIVKIVGGDGQYYCPEGFKISGDGGVTYTKIGRYNDANSSGSPLPYSYKFDGQPATWARYTGNYEMFYVPNNERLQCKGAPINVTAGYILISGMDSNPSNPTPINYIRISSPGVSKALKFDFETTSDTPETGYTHVDDSNSYSYSGELGYGFRVVPTGNARSRTVGSQNALLKDFIYITSANVFQVDLPNGDYRIKIVGGDGQYATNQGFKISGDGGATYTKIGRYNIGGSGNPRPYTFKFNGQEATWNRVGDDEPELFYVPGDQFLECRDAAVKVTSGQLLICTSAAMAGTGTAMNYLEIREAVNSATLKFDFEPSSGTTETGYTHIDDSNCYSVEQGYGFTVVPTGNARSRTVGSQTALLKDFISLTSGMPFQIDVMNGTYIAEVVGGDGQYYCPEGFKISGDGGATYTKIGRYNDANSSGSPLPYSFKFDGQAATWARYTGNYEMFYVPNDERLQCRGAPIDVTAGYILISGMDSNSSYPTPINYIRLSRPGVSKGLKFDFETTSGTTETGYTHVDDSNSYSYSVGQGYGFTVVPTGGARSRTVGTQDALLKDFIYIRSGNAFRVDVPNGDYRIRILGGDGQYATYQGFLISGDGGDTYTKIGRYNDANSSGSPLPFTYKFDGQPATWSRYTGNYEMFTVSINEFIECRDDTVKVKSGHILIRSMDANAETALNCLDIDEVIRAGFDDTIAGCADYRAGQFDNYKQHGLNTMVFLARVASSEVTDMNYDTAGIAYIMQWLEPDKLEKYPLDNESEYIDFANQAATYGVDVYFAHALISGEWVQLSDMLGSYDQTFLAGPLRYESSGIHPLPDPLEEDYWSCGMIRAAAEFYAHLSKVCPNVKGFLIDLETYSSGSNGKVWMPRNHNFGDRSFYAVVAEMKSRGLLDPNYDPCSVSQSNRYYEMEGMGLLDDYMGIQGDLIQEQIVTPLREAIDNINEDFRLGFLTYEATPFVDSWAKGLSTVRAPVIILEESSYKHLRPPVFTALEDHVDSLNINSRFLSGFNLLVAGPDGNLPDANAFKMDMKRSEEFGVDGWWVYGTTTLLREEEGRMSPGDPCTVSPAYQYWDAIKDVNDGFEPLSHTEAYQVDYQCPAGSSLLMGNLGYEGNSIVCPISVSYSPEPNLTFFKDPNDTKLFDGGEIFDQWTVAWKPVLNNDIFATVDLGGLYAVDKMLVVAGNHLTRFLPPTGTLYVDTSENGSTWDSVGNRSLSAAKDDTHSIYNFSNGRSARYIRIKCTPTAVADNSAFSFSELAVWGRPILLKDGFESGFNLWTDGGTTDWDRTTSYKYSGSYSAHAGSSDNDLISDNLNTSGWSSMIITFWYRDDDIDDDDNIYLQLYDGTNYDDKFELGNTSPEDTWQQYTVTLSNTGGDTQYFHSNFRLKFEGTSIDSGENLWIDDVSVVVQD